jgi:hypothetical protein
MVGSFAPVRSATFTLYLTPIIPLFLEKRKYNQHVTVVFGRFSATDFDSAAKRGRTWGRGAKIRQICAVAASRNRVWWFPRVSSRFPSGETTHSQHPYGFDGSDFLVSKKTAIPSLSLLSLFFFSLK